MTPDPRVRWPDGLAPASCRVFAHDELEADVSPAQFWARLIDARQWHTWYPHCKGLRMAEAQLALGTRFTWWTLGVRVTTTVDHFEPERYLSWTGTSMGSRGHHVWLIEPTARGCRVVTEETQRGLAATLLAPALRRALHHHHPRWLAGLADASRATGRGM